MIAGKIVEMEDFNVLLGQVRWGGRIERDRGGRMREIKRVGERGKEREREGNRERDNLKEKEIKSKKFGEIETEGERERERER